MSLIRLSKTEEALPALFRAYELFPNFNTKISIADLQIQVDERSAAVETLQDVLQFAPDAIDVLVKLGCLMYEQEDVEGCFDCFSKAVFVASKQLESQKCIVKQQYQAFLGMGCLLQQDDPQAALLKYRAVGQSANAELWSNLADLFLDLKQFQAAVLCARRAFRLSQSDTVRYQLGSVYVRLGDYNRAYNILVYFVGSENLEAKWLLGVAAGKLGQLKMCYNALATVGKQIYGAALAGLKIAAEQKDFETCSKFSAILKANESGTEQERELAKTMVRWIKSQIKTEAPPVQEETVPEVVKQEKAAPQQTIEKPTVKTAQVVAEPPIQKTEQANEELEQPMEKLPMGELDQEDVGEEVEEEVWEEAELDAPPPMSINKEKDRDDNTEDVR